MNVPIEYCVNRSTAADVAAHLACCDAEFDPPLSARVDLQAFARKLATHAERFEAWSDGVLVGLVAAYCNDSEAAQAFVTSVSVLPSSAGLGIARRLMKDCLAHAQRVGMRRVSLEVGRNNSRAVGLYSKLGFVAEPRPDSAMLVMRLALSEGGPRNG